MQDVFWHSCTKNSKQQQGLEMGFPAAVGTLSDTATDPQKGDKRKGKPNEELQPRGQDGTQRAVCTACLLLTKDFFCSGEAQHSISTSEFLGLLSVIAEPCMEQPCGAFCAAVLTAELLHYLLCTKHLNP